MSPLLFAVILVVSIIVLVWIFIKIDRNRSKKKNQLQLDNFNGIANENKIVITKHEIFRNKIIGIDYLKRFFLVFEFENSNNPKLISLADIKSCTLVKEYGHINAGSENKPMMERYLESIDLKFSMKNKPESISVSIYENHINTIDQMVDLESRGKEWEKILSQIIP